jgi:uncharacterized protein YecE (DUF72 family)
MVKVGLCGFTINFREYVETYPVVEVQQTFYEPPAPRTMLKWREQAGPGFEFTLKAWQLITHLSSSSTYKRLKTPLTPAERAECGAFRNTPTVMRGWEATREAARILRATAILFQCPASFKATDENVANMHRFFAGIDRPDGVRLLWEPRGPWPDDVIRTLCASLGLIHVVDPFVRPSLTPELIYWRLHGIGSAYRSYTDAELQQLIEWLPRTPGERYVMFNNVPRPMNAQRFVKLFRQNRDVTNPG